jgi:cytochrome o ubiquinol oxidase operon protein cyoD
MTDASPRGADGARPQRPTPDQVPGQTPGEGLPGGPPQRHEVWVALRKVAFGLGASLLLTGASFWAAGSPHVYAPSVPVLLAALAIGQMGVHLVFFLHVSSGPEATNNIIALAFGVFVVALVVFGSMVIMANLDANMGGMAHATGTTGTTDMPSAGRSSSP